MEKTRENKIREYRQTPQILNSKSIFDIPCLCFGHPTISSFWRHVIPTLWSPKNLKTKAWLVLF